MSNILTNKISPRSGNTITIGKAGDTVSIAGTLSYEDVSSVDSVGIITAQSGINVTGGVTVGTGATLDGSTNTITASTNGSERVRIDSSGRFGIGTNSPGRQLQINGDSDTQIRVVASAGGNAGIQFGDADDSVMGGVNFDASDDSLQLRGFNNTEAMRIDSSGNVQIGSTSTNSARLSISGSDNTAYSATDVPYASNCNLLINNDDTTLVGSYSGLAFRVYGDNANASRGSIGLIKTSSSGSNGAMVFGMRGNSFGDIEERIRIDSSGNFGIGNTSPSSYNSSADNLVIGNTGDNGITIATGDSSQGSLFFADGTSGTAVAEGYLIYVHGPTEYMALGTSNEERMRIDSAGNTFFEGRVCTSTTSGNTGDTKTLTLNNIDEGAAYLVTLTTSPNISSVFIYQTLIRYDGNGDFEGQDDIVNTAPGNMTITYGNASGGTATITYVNGGTQRFRVTALRVN